MTEELNKNNFKEIAKTIKRYNFDNKSAIAESIAYDLADYFEKEAIRYTPLTRKKIIEFNKEQFLKECGIKT